MNHPGLDGPGTPKHPVIGSSEEGGRKGSSKPHAVRQAQSQGTHALTNLIQEIAELVDNLDSRGMTSLPSSNRSE